MIIESLLLERRAWKHEGRGGRAGEDCRDPGLPTEWNTMTILRQYRVNPGSVYYEGIVGPQIHRGILYEGGARQIIVLPKNRIIIK